MKNKEIKIGTIGQRINFIIKALGLKKKEVAKTLGITDRYFVDITNDKAKNISTHIYKSFCYEYNIDYDWLMTGKINDIEVFERIKRFAFQVKKPELLPLLHEQMSYEQKEFDTTPALVAESQTQYNHFIIPSDCSANDICKKICEICNNLNPSGQKALLRMAESLIADADFKKLKQIRSGGGTGK